MKAFNALNTRYTKSGHWWGYYKSLEVTYNQDNNTYHPHLHVIADGRYIPQVQLSTDWYGLCSKHGVINIPQVMIDNKSLAVDIRLTYKPWELCKYVVKPDTLNYAAVYELVQSGALKGLRDNAAGGTLKKVIANIKKDIKIAKAEQKETFGLAKYIRAISYYWTGDEYERR